MAALPGAEPADHRPAGFPQNNYFYATPGTPERRTRAISASTTASATRTACSARLSWSNRTSSTSRPFPGALDGTPFNAGDGRGPGPQRAAELHARLEPDHHHRDPRRLHPPGDLARRARTPTRTSSRNSASAATTRLTALNGGLASDAVRQQHAATRQIGANDWLPSKEYSNVWDFIQNVAITKGGHSLKFGAEYRPIKFPFFQVPYPHGEMNFSRNETAYPSQPDR